MGFVRDTGVFRTSVRRDITSIRVCLTVVVVTSYTRSSLPLGRVRGTKNTGSHVTHESQKIYYSVIYLYTLVLVYLTPEGTELNDIVNGQNV